MSTSHHVSMGILLIGPGGAAGLYWMLYRYYRNTDKSFDFEHKAKVEAKVVAVDDTKVGTNNGTTQSRINGDNVRSYRNRVKRS